MRLRPFLSPSPSPSPLTHPFPYEQALRLVGDTTAFQFRCIPPLALVRLQLRLVGRVALLHHAAWLTRASGE